MQSIGQPRVPNFYRLQADRALNACAGDPRRFQWPHGRANLRVPHADKDDFAGGTARWPKSVTGGANPRIDGGISAAEDKAKVGGPALPNDIRFGSDGSPRASWPRHDRWRIDLVLLRR